MSVWQAQLGGGQSGGLAVPLWAPKVALGSWMLSGPA